MVHIIFPFGVFLPFRRDASLRKYLLIISINLYTLRIWMAVGPGDMRRRAYYIYFSALLDTASVSLAAFLVRNPANGKGNFLILYTP